MCAFQGETPMTVNLCAFEDLVDVAKPGDRMEVYSYTYVHSVFCVYTCRYIFVYVYIHVYTYAETEWRYAYIRMQVVYIEYAFVCM